MPLSLVQLYIPSAAAACTELYRTLYYRDTHTFNRIDSYFPLLRAVLFTISFLYRERETR